MFGTLLLALPLWLAPAPSPHAALGPRMLAPQHPTGIARRRVGKVPRKLVAAKHRKAVRVKKLVRPLRPSFVPCTTTRPQQAPRPAAALAAGREGLVAHTEFLWPNGATLNVHFTDGSMAARHAVAEVAAEWTKHANLELAFFFDENAPPPVTHVRVKFDDPACNSALGTTSQYSIDAGDVSMRLCHVDGMVGTDGFQRVVLHEFGHALGMEHEHQSPNAHFDWDKPAVYEYYWTTQGWDQAFVDQWVFRQVEASTVDASEYDPTSVMQYFFPPEFTRDHRAITGSSELSELDKAWIARSYPGRAPKGKGKGKPKGTGATRRFERAIALRNGTGVALDVQLVYETKRDGAWTWLPEASPTAAEAIRIEADQELALPGAPAGRKVKLLARSADGRSTWSSHAERPLVIAGPQGYLDRQRQSWVVTIDGPADATALDRDSLYADGLAALDAGRYDEARDRFRSFIARFPDDAWRPWAELSLVIVSMGERSWFEALSAAYDLAIAHPDTDAGAFAWYYGGVAAMQLGKCDDARAWFAGVADGGLPQDWRDAAKENLAALERDAASWCG
ncbi:MAG: hypothetical protein U0168_21225 [Nannocystaceae bacterium]